MPNIIPAENWNNLWLLQRYPDNFEMGCGLQKGINGTVTPAVPEALIIARNQLYDTIFTNITISLTVSSLEWFICTIILLF